VKNILALHGSYSNDNKSKVVASTTISEFFPLFVNSVAPEVDVGNFEIPSEVVGVE
jgi:hypothetical protein